MASSPQDLLKQTSQHPETQVVKSKGGKKDQIPADDTDKLEAIIQKAQEERAALSKKTKEQLALLEEDKQLLDLLEKSADKSQEEMKTIDKEILDLQKEIDALSKAASYSESSTTRDFSLEAITPSQFQHSKTFNWLVVFLLFLTVIVLFGIFIGIDEVTFTRRLFRLLLGRARFGGVKQPPS